MRKTQTKKQMTSFLFNLFFDINYHKNIKLINTQVFFILFN